MGYRIGKYRTAEGKEYNLLSVTFKENKLFHELLAEYESSTSWKEFQERTARKTVELARETMKGDNLRWENYFLIEIRMDLLRNVGIRTGELPGEISDMLLGHTLN